MILDYSTQLYEYQPTERLFSVTKNYLHLEIHKYSKLSGVKKIRIQDLRHSYASMLIEYKCTTVRNTREIRTRRYTNNIKYLFSFVP